MVESCEGKSQDQMKKKKKRIGGSKEIKLIWANNRRKCQSYEKYMCCNDNNNRCPVPPALLLRNHKTQVCTTKREFQLFFLS